MKHYLLFILFICTTLGAASAATISLQPVEQSDGSIRVSVVLDPEGSSINAVSGTMSLSKDYFDTGTVNTEDSVVPLWLERPAVSQKVDWSGLYHFHFEGAIPGGFSGIRSPYYKGEKPGTLFSFILRPKKTGSTLLLLDEADMYANDGSGTKVHMGATSFPLLVERLAASASPRKEEHVHSEALTAFITKNELVADDAWTVVFGDDETKQSVNHYEIAESKEYYPDTLSSYEWQEASSPYVLRHQKRDVFVHVKAAYADGAYAVFTLPPVENIDTTSNTSSILILIALALLSLYVLYAYKKRD
jgi:hypothetical protein